MERQAQKVARQAKRLERQAKNSRARQGSLTRESLSFNAMDGGAAQSAGSGGVPASAPLRRPRMKRADSSLRAAFSASDLPATFSRL